MPIDSNDPEATNIAERKPLFSLCRRPQLKFRVNKENLGLYAVYTPFDPTNNVPPMTTTFMSKFIEEKNDRSITFIFINQNYEIFMDV